MGWLDDVGASTDMEFPEGVTVQRLRAGRTWDPYSETYIEGDWDNPDVLDLPGAFIAQASTSSTQTEHRTQVLETKSLYLTEPDADVREGDRVRVWPAGAQLTVGGVPAADTNPWTGWQPVREVPLTWFGG